MRVSRPAVAVTTTALAALAALGLGNPAGASDEDGLTCAPFARGSAVKVGETESIVVLNGTYRVTGTRARPVSGSGFEESIVSALDLGGGRGLAVTAESELLTIDRRGLRRHPYRGAALDVAPTAILGFVQEGLDVRGNVQLAVRFLTRPDRAVPVPGQIVDSSSLLGEPDAFAADREAAWLDMNANNKLYRVDKDGTVVSITLPDEIGELHADGSGGAWRVVGGEVVRQLGADGRQIRRISLRGSTGGEVSTVVVIGGRLHVFMSRKVGGRSSLELVRIDRRGRVERLAVRRATGEPRIVARRGSGLVLAWREGRRELVGTLAAPVAAPGVVVGLYPLGADTLVVSRQGEATFGRVLRGTKLGKAFRFGGPCP